MCPSILLSISCTRKKQAKLEHTKHKKERKGSKENDGTEERRKNISKTNTEQLPTTTEEKKDSVEMGGLRIARQDRKRDEDHKIELNEPRRKTNRKTKPQDVIIVSIEIFLRFYAKCFEYSISCLRYIGGGRGNACKINQTNLKRLWTRDNELKIIVDDHFTTLPGPLQM